MVHEHPIEVAVYAAKHDYPDLVSQMAPIMISMNFVKVVEMLPPYMVLPWIRYAQEWAKVHREIALVLRHGGREHEYGIRLGAGVHTLRTLDEVFDVSGEHAAIKVYEGGIARSTPNVPECCRKDLEAWRKRIEEGIEKIPTFSSFL
ncbi:hypothetical protein MSAN_01093800 [Mycena sanguinolenta]|uniref:Uncharacterized protein n=1 Tax=Mycena sanguinolenta TaxID=230812 RepID=A0A8H6YNF2_9AGAR|nr:hypothetical protein MSAN_01093800 [Mycena sanguinolenta]